MARRNYSGWRWGCQERNLTPRSDIGRKMGTNEKWVGTAFLHNGSEACPFFKLSILLGGSLSPTSVSPAVAMSPLLGHYDTRASDWLFICRNGSVATRGLQNRAPGQQYACAKNPAVLKILLGICLLSLYVSNKQTQKVYTCDPTRYEPRGHIFASKISSPRNYRVDNPVTTHVTGL